MKAMTMLKKQHRQVEKLFSQIERARDKERRVSLVKELADSLAAHMLIEEQVFYPAAAAVLDDPTMVQEGIVEHHAARAALSVVLTPNGQVSPDAALKALKEMIEHHAKEEEEELFPTLESVMDEGAEKALGAEMKALFEQATAAGYRRVLASVPAEPPLQTLSLGKKGGGRKAAQSEAQVGGR